MTDRALASETTEPLGDAAEIFVTVPNRGSRFPDRPRERATRSTWALRAMVETPPWAAATLRNAFINSRGSPSDSSIAALRYAATSSGVRRYSLASWALTGMPLLLSVCLPDGFLVPPANRTTRSSPSRPSLSRSADRSSTDSRTGRRIAPSTA